MMNNFKSISLKYLPPLIISIIYLFLSILFSVRNSLWHDESYTYLILQAPIDKIIYYTSLDVHPPLYYLLLKIWASIFGYSFFALNLFSIILMICAVLIVWSLFKRAYKYSNQHLNYVLLALIFFTPFTIRYGQEIRMYSLGALITAALLFIIYLLNSRNSNPKYLWVITGLLLALGFYTHYFLVFNLAAFVIFYLFLTIKDTGFKSLFKNFHHWYISLIVFLIAVIPWLPVVINQFRQVSNGFWIAPMDGSSIQNYFISYSLYLNDWELKNYLGVLASISLSISIFALYRYIKVKTNSKFKMISLIWLVVPLIFLIIMSLPPFEPTFHPRYLFFWSPVLYGAIATGLLYTIYSKWLYKLIFALYCIIISIGLFLAFSIGNSASFDYKKPFMMDQVLGSISIVDTSNNSAIISQDLRSFFDLYATSKELGMNNQIFVYNSGQFGKYGNQSLVHDRQDLVINSLDDERLVGLDRVWVLLNNKDVEFDYDIPNNWQLINSDEKGYVIVNEYKVN